MRPICLFQNVTPTFAFISMPGSIELSDKTVNTYVEEYLVL